MLLLCIKLELYTPFRVSTLFIKSIFYQLHGTHKLLKILPHQGSDVKKMVIPLNHVAKQESTSVISPDAYGYHGIELVSDGNTLMTLHFFMLFLSKLHIVIFCGVSNKSTVILFKEEVCWLFLLSELFSAIFLEDTGSGRS